MRKTLMILVLACGFARGQSSDSTKPPETDPITDKLRLEIARTQRDLLLADAKMKEAVERYNAARNEAEGLQRTLAEKVAEAGKACGDKQTFDSGKLACVQKPSPAKDK